MKSAFIAAEVCPWSERRLPIALNLTSVPGQGQGMVAAAHQAVAVEQVAARAAGVEAAQGLAAPAALQAAVEAAAAGGAVTRAAAAVFL